MNDFVQSTTGLEGRVLSRRIAVIIAGTVCGGLFVALTAVFLTFSAYLALLDHLAPWQAALAIAGASLFIALIALFIAFNLAGKTAEQVKQGARSSAVGLMAPVLFRLVARNAKLAAGLAALVGALFALLRVTGRSPKSEG
jgi:hypothetical protein